MKNTYRLLVVLVLAGAIASVLAVKNRSDGREVQPQAGSTSVMAQPLPRLVDLGAGTCIPCKQMKPILEELTKEYADRFEVEFIDVVKNKGAGTAYNIGLIPTQIFYDAKGKELHRHEGFLGKEDILATWRDLGIAVSTPSAE